MARLEAPLAIVRLGDTLSVLVIRHRLRTVKVSIVHVTIFLKLILAQLCTWRFFCYADFVRDNGASQKSWYQNAFEETDMYLDRDCRSSKEE